MREGARGDTSFSESDIHRQLLTLHLDHVAEGAVAPAAKVETDPGVADAQVADVEPVEPVGEHRVHDIELLSGRARPDPEDGSQHEEDGPRSPGLRRARDGIVDRV